MENSVFAGHELQLNLSCSNCAFHLRQIFLLILFNLWGLIVIPPQYNFKQQLRLFSKFNTDTFCNPNFGWLTGSDSMNIREANLDKNISFWIIYPENNLKGYTKDRKKKQPICSKVIYNFLV